jgi:hypothetical protein
MHHNNVDRLYEAWLAEHPDACDDFERHQKTLGKGRPVPGFPEGPFGPYEPFTNHLTGKPFHARDTFETSKFGFQYDVLPKVMPKQMRAPPVRSPTGPDPPQPPSESMGPTRCSSRSGTR